MKISLLYHPSAGEGVSAGTLCHELENSGHEVVDVAETDSDVERMLEHPAELVVAAGGDGTVWRAANALAGRDVPLAILPLGTANNIAYSLGIRGSTREIIESWKRARRLPVDLGIARGQWGESRFVEGVGSGLIPGGISAVEEEDEDGAGEEPDDTEARLTRALRKYREVLGRMTARRWGLRVDGVPLDGEFLLLEVLNIRAVGPNLLLSPDGDPSDGLLCVVTAGEEHRDKLDRYLGARAEGREPRLDLPVRRARQIEIEGWEEMHLDDAVCSGPVGAVSIRVEAAVLQFLA